MTIWKPIRKFYIRTKKVVATDPSPDMTGGLSKKSLKKNAENIEIRIGYFPETLEIGERFDSVITSFILPHLLPEQPQQLMVEVFNCLKEGK